MKQQSTPSLILEGYKQTDAHRLREAEKWLFWIKEYLEIPEDKYRTLEVVFRQLLIHPKMNTAFAYQFDEHFKLSSDSKKIKSDVSSYLSKVTTKSNYGLHSLNLEKKEIIKSAERFLKNEYASLKKMEEFALRIKKESSLISEKELITHIETLKLIAKEKIRSSIHDSKTHTLKKFVEIKSDGSIAVKAKSFDFFITYCLLMTALWEPHFKNRSEAGSRPKGLNGFIARKLAFEFGKRLGFHPTSKDVADKVRDNHQLLKHYRKRIHDLGLADISLIV
jgi:hypothetical protein